jgi:hypothetical protein
VPTINLSDVPPTNYLLKSTVTISHHIRKKPQLRKQKQTSLPFKTKPITSFLQIKPSNTKKRDYSPENTPSTPKTTSTNGQQSLPPNPTLYRPYKKHEIHQVHSTTPDPIPSPSHKNLGGIAGNTSPAIQLPTQTKPQSNLPCLVRLLPSDLYPSTHWAPNDNLPVGRSLHPLDSSCPPDHLETLREICRYPSSSTFVYIAPNPTNIVSVKELRDMLSHNKMINQQILHSFLHILATQFHLSYLDSQFFTILQSQGWSAVQKWIACSSPRSRPKSPSHPTLDDSVISIPCHVQGCHWVAVTRRIKRGQVTFYYSDDINDNSTEEMVRQVLSSSDPTFYHSSSQWIVCNAPNFHPHYNECGVRTLLALLIHALHPSPTSAAFTPWMHANLAILCRTWVATSILHSYIDTSQIKNLLEASSYHQVSHIQAHPRYIIDWHTTKEPTIHRRLSIESFSPKRGQVKDKPKPSPSPNLPTLSSGHHTTLTSNNISSDLQILTSSPQIANYL